MKVSGFTFIRNGLIYDYPFRESIRSVLPLVDEMIVNVPFSDDDTYQAVLDIGDPKLKVFQTEWGGDKPSAGRILSHHTNLALQKCTGNWCVYIQADELMHEADYENIYKAMKENLDDNRINGLLFDYLHFYGSYKCVATARNWYRHEVRIIKNNQNILSHADAQGFRHLNEKKPDVRKANARIFHYGWVRPIESMRMKTTALDRLWHGEKRDEQNSLLNYKMEQYGLKLYKGAHPEIMKNRIECVNWNFDFKSKIKTKKEYRYWLSDILESIIGRRLFEYKGYKLWT